MAHLTSVGPPRPDRQNVPTGGVRAGSLQARAANPALPGQRSAQVSPRQRTVGAEARGGGRRRAVAGGGGRRRAEARGGLSGDPLERETGQPEQSPRSARVRCPRQIPPDRRGRPTSCSPYLKLCTRLVMVRLHPSTSTNNSSLNGSEIMAGGSMNMPILMSTLATTASMMMNGK